MNEEKLEKISKELGIPIVDIEEAIELSQSIINQTDKHSQYLKILNDAKCDLKHIAQTYYDLLESEEKEDGSEERGSVAAAKILVFWTERAISEFAKAGLAKDLEQMMYVYNHSPDDKDLDAVMIHAMVEFL